MMHDPERPCRRLDEYSIGNTSARLAEDGDRGISVSRDVKTGPEGVHDQSVRNAWIASVLQVEGSFTAEDEFLRAPCALEPSCGDYAAKEGDRSWSRAKTRNEEGKLFCGQRDVFKDYECRVRTRIDVLEDCNLGRRLLPIHLVDAVVIDPNGASVSPQA